MWDFPHCIGALDGKHVVMIAPPSSGSTFYNYKGQHSIVLMAIADAEYKFLYVDVGCNGRVSDGGVFNKCSFARAMGNDGLNLPDASPLLGREMKVPFMLVADDAFALRPNVMKPYPGRELTVAQRIYNYRLSRTRRIVENAFGILSARFRVFRRPIYLDADKTKRITLACSALHNFLIEKSSSYVSSLVDDAENLIPDEIQIEETPNNTDEANPPNHTTQVNAKIIREELKEYFMSVHGELSWQFQRI